MQFETLTLEITNGVGLLTLNRPNEMNAFNGQMAQDLFDAAIECDTNPAIRSVVVTGSGKMFSAGGDLKEFLAAGDAVPAFVTRMLLSRSAGRSHLRISRSPPIHLPRGPNMSDHNPLNSKDTLQTKGGDVTIYRLDRLDVVLSAR